MRTALEVRNGLVLKLGSSLIIRSSATRLPENTDRLKSPSFTLRPSVAESCFSIAGRNVFARTKRRIDTIARTNRPAITNRIFAQRFTDVLRRDSSQHQRGSTPAVYAGRGSD